MYIRFFLLKTVIALIISAHRIHYVAYSIRDDIECREKLAYLKE